MFYLRLRFFSLSINMSLLFSSIASMCLGSARFNVLLLWNSGLSVLMVSHISLVVSFIHVYLGFPTLLFIGVLLSIRLVGSLCV